MDAPVIVVGAGPAGLACAAVLKARGIAARVLERENTVAPVWDRHYDRLHLHTDRRHSGLPGLPMPRRFAKYPSRDEVISYFQSYAQHHAIEPEFGCAVDAIRPSGGWTLTTSRGLCRARAVIVAAGMAAFPHRPTWTGLETFPGEVLHSSDYRNATAFRNRRVLIVGFGNSGGEIALDLAGRTAETSLAVRGPVSVVPRDILGIPILSFAIAEAFLPYRLADAINRPVVWRALGDITRLGLVPAAKGPLAGMVENGRVPLLDIGTLAAIGRGAIRLRPGIERIDGACVRFTDRTEAVFDAIVLATGFRPDFRALLPDNGAFLTPSGAPKSSGPASGGRGLYFCGLRAAPTGQLREIGIEATRIARVISRTLPT